MEKNWWQKAIVYQIYPKSFYDSNGDGVGDLNGVTRKLDYLEQLGIDVIWLSPINSSPMCDNGYDIADYYTVDPIFGTNEDFDYLLAEAKKRGIRIVMDLVINHCSTQHEWFQKGLKNPEGEYGQYFYFRKGKGGKLPNNWRSIFGGSVWEKVPNSDYYYMHLFTKEQPDLNWENPKVREEIYKMMNYWLDKGVAGFRLDAITYLKKEEGLPSYPADADDGMVSVHYGTLNSPGIEKFFNEMKERTYERYNGLTVGEAAGVSGKEMLPFVSLKDGYFSMIFDFSYIQLQLKEPNYFWCDRQNWDVKTLRDNMFETHLSIQPDGWIANCLENHDLPRAIDHFLPEEGRNFYGASMLAVMYMYLRGTPFIYQGQELGMRNFTFDSIDDYDDCSSNNQFYYALERGFSKEEAFEFVTLQSRDNSRYPFQWDSSEKAGFTTGTPWLPVNPEHLENNVESEQENKKSLLRFYQKLISLRKSRAYQEILTIGEIKPILEDQSSIVAYKRQIEGDSRSIKVICNYQNCKFKLEFSKKYDTVLLNNYEKLVSEEGKIILQPFQAVVLES